MEYYTVESKNKSIFKTFAIYYIAMFLFCVVRILATLDFFPDGKWGEVLSTLIIQIVILLLLPAVLTCLLKRISPKNLVTSCNFNKCNFRVILISIGIGLLCFFINIAVSSLFNGILAFTGYDFTKFSYGVEAESMTVWNFLIDVLIVAVIPAFCEEFLHRGLVLQGIKHAGFKKAIVISSMLFALLHFNIRQVSYAFVIGLILGLVSVVAKNIWPSIIIHFINNFISTYLDYAEANGWWLGNTMDSVSNALTNNNSALVFVVCVIVLLVIIALLCLLMWRLYKQSILKSVYSAIDKVYEAEGAKKDSPIKINKDDATRDIIENCTLLNLDYHSMQNPIDAILPKEISRYKTIPRDRIFMWGAVVMAGLITLFTYIWGLI